MQNEGRKVHGNEAVESDNRRLFGLERENHVPNGCSIESCKSGAKATRGPVQDGDGDDIWEATKSAEKQTSICVEFLVVDVGWDGARSRNRGREGWKSLSHHVGKLPVDGQRRVVELVSILALSERGDWLKFVLQGLPLSYVRLRPAVMAFCTDALEACSVLAVVERVVCENFGFGAECVGAGYNDISFVEVSVAQFPTWAFLSLSVKLGSDFNCASI